jgi:DNA primase
VVRIPEGTIQEIRDRVDIVGLIGRYVDLKKAGRNYKGRCPFHDEKTPSFNVNSERQIFHCFGCQEGGNAISFLMKHENLTFPEAARTLAQECGIEIPESHSGERGISEQLFAANQIAYDFYCATLATPEAEPARQYLEERGMDADAIERFGIGFAPNRWDALQSELASKGIPEAISIKAGLLVEKDAKGRSTGRSNGRNSYDRQRGRVIFPIRDVRDRVIGFGGRAIFPDQEPKYINTPESDIFHKREALYGFPLALEGIRKRDRIIACEGYFDRIALDRAGLIEGLATCGTALTQGHGVQMSRRAREIVLLFDGDEAGQNAVIKALDVLLPIGLRVRAALLPPGADPDSYLVDKGRDALCDLVDHAPDALEIAIRRAVKNGCTTPTEKSSAVSQVAPTIALIRDPVERVEWARRLALVVGADESAVEVVVRRAGRSSQGERHASNAAHAPEAQALSGPASQSSRPASQHTSQLTSQPQGREEQHLFQLAQVIHRRPDLVNAALVERIEELIPVGSWKSILQLFIEAAEHGDIDAKGLIDLDTIVARVDQEAAAKLTAIGVSERLEEEQSTEEGLLDDLFSWFEKRRHTANSESTTRRLRDPNADEETLLAEKQRQLEARRAAQKSESRTFH